MKQPGGIGKLFAGINVLAEDLWITTKPHVMKVVGPVHRFITQPMGRHGTEWNPFRSDAVYFGRRDSRFYHGLTWSALIQVLVLIWFTFGDMVGCNEYLMPQGGGANAVMAQQMMKVQKVKKIKKKKQIVNVNSPIIFETPDIDKMMETKVTEALQKGTANLYAQGMLGSGKGDSAGYSSGHGLGEVKLIRLKYAGGDWDSNFGKGADNNMLLEYKIRSGQKTANESTAIDIHGFNGLNSYKKFRAPPMVYITGTGKLDITDKEATTLRKYIQDNNGMVFADAASPSWGKSFKDTMKKVLPDVKPVPITIDDDIFKMPFTLSSVPYASPHDPPMVLTGWKINGRWAVIYHPGDIGDCWKDGHSGVSAETAEASYQLGLNIIHYAHSRYNMWVTENKGAKQ